MGSEDSILIEGLRVYGHHGLHPFEKDYGRVFIIDLECNVDLEPSGLSDSMNDTVDYQYLVQRIRDLVQTQRFDLIEKLAERIAAIGLENDRVEEVTVRVAKQGPPVGADVDAISVEIHRRR